MCVCVCVCVCARTHVCYPTSVWQNEVCNTMKVIMHLRHVSLSRGMGAERYAGWWVQRDIISRRDFPLRGTQEMLKVIKTGMSRINTDGDNL